MADTYELQLTLDLPDSLSPGELGVLRWHLAEEGGRQDEGYEYSLWDGRGPARRIGGLQVAELRSVRGGWSLTVRQEAHPDGFHDLRRIVQWLGARTTTSGPIGYLRFYESHVPDMLIARSGTVSCAFLKVDEVIEVASEEFPYT
ncbi:hypothetical protein HW130_24925 [Streptomyces sp. PKU-EA00015]|uniref:hypothetical protein n=1 Tax=Streptomyces sp. PKU-EA00015 TaxID=2748326 RepID=UPI0015A13743|nr:hypothetical protein [Streptomyces sp. PKU-EA00015]NWF29462.1 hypothetical protein [Streptomyces sp. PKU-EA00015]